MISAILAAAYDTGRNYVTRGVLFSCLPLLALCSCSNRSFDRERFAENTARYATKPLHKALYMNSVDFALYQRFGGADVQQMLAEAEHDCKVASGKRGVDPDRCAPLYMEDVRLIDPDLYQ